MEHWKNVGKHWGINDDPGEQGIEEDGFLWITMLAYQSARIFGRKNGLAEFLMFCNHRNASEVGASHRLVQRECHPPSQFKYSCKSTLEFSMDFQFLGIGGVKFWYLTRNLESGKFGIPIGRTYPLILRIVFTVQVLPRCVQGLYWIHSKNMDISFWNLAKPWGSP